MNITARDLRVTKGGFHLTVSSLEVVTGGILALIGPNGSGKSTLLRAMAGLEPCQGEVHMGGDALHGLPDLERARRIAWVPQAESHAFDFTVGELVATAAYFGRDADVAAAITRFDLGQLAGQSVRSISGGELQRALIARAWATGAPILLLDEPTAHLDVAHLGALAATIRGSGRTVVLASHDLNWAASVASQVLLLKAGQVVSRELTPESLAQAFDARLVQATTPDGRTIWAAPSW